jgi:hypothetical protein
MLECGGGRQSSRHFGRDAQAMDASAVVFQTNARMQQNSGAAAAVLFKLMADPTTPASVRARTAQCVLECANKSLDLEDMEVRLAALERAAEESKQAQ